MANRIISLLASGTEIVAALGLGDRLVGISHECDHPPDLLDRPRTSRPRFEPAGMDSGQIDRAVRAAMAEHGSVYQVDEQLLAELEPDLILTQAVCEVCAVPTPGVRETVSRLGLGAAVLSLDAHTLEDILESVRQVADAAGVSERGESLETELRARLDAVRSTVAGARRPRVLGIEWLDPPFMPGHWVPEMIEAAGGECLVGEPGARSTEMGWDQLAGMDPDVLLIMPCGYGLEASRADADRAAERLTAVAPRAVSEGRAYVVDGSSYMNRSGPRAIDGVEILAGLFHGPDADGRADAPPPGTADVWSAPAVR